MPITLTYLQSLSRLIRGSFGNLIWTGVLFRALGVAIITPLVGLLASWFMAQTGRAVLIDQDIAAFLLNPLGALGAVIIITLGLTLLALEQGALLTLFRGVTIGAPTGAINAIGFALARAPAISRLAGAVVLRVILVSIPFFALAGLVYLGLLTDYDINYYLAEKPREYQLALALITLIGTGLLICLTWFLSRYTLALPILLFESTTPAQALSKSQQRTQGHKTRIVSLLLTWGVFSLLLAFLLGLPGWIIGKALVPMFSDQTILLVFLLGVLLVVIFLTELAASFISSAALSALIVVAYCADPHAQEEWTEPLAPLRKTQFSLAGISTIAVVIALISILTGTWLIQDTDLADHAEITAHRGASGLAPENTLASIELAVVQEAEWVEIDVQFSGDGIVVVTHDRDLRRIGQSSLVISETSYTDLAKVDIGSWFAPEFADQRLATLKRVLELCRNRVGVNIELKYYGWVEALAPAVIELVEKAGMVDQVKIMSLDRRAVAQTKTLRPGWQVGQLTAVSLGDLTRIEADFVAIHSANATASFVARVHDSGKHVEVWTVNDVAGLHAMFSIGVDSIITDFPAQAVELRVRRAELSATERLLLRFGLLVLDSSEHQDPSIDMPENLESE
jgi:glycerophosphoryl diester phosphodiesterase